MKQLLFVGVMICAATLTAQKLPDKVQFQSLPINEFANYSAVNDFDQDPHGLVWVACNGLLRFDGTRFTDVTQNQSDTLINLRGREINKIFWDKLTNRLLITTRNYGLLSYTYETDKITSIPTQTYGAILRDFIREDDSTIWITTQEKGIFRLKNNTLQRYKNLSEVITSPSAAIAYRDELIFGDVNKIFFVQHGELKETLPLKRISNELSINTRVTSLLVDRQENLWIGTEKNGVIVYSLPQKKTVKLFSPSNTPLYNRIEKIIQDKKGLVWITTKANGLVIYSPELDAYTHVRQLFFRSGSNPIGTCNTIMEDNTGVIWVGSIGEVRKYDPSQLPFEHFQNNPEDDATLSDNMTRGISEDSRGIIWIPTEGGFLNRFDRTTNKTERIKLSIAGENEHLTGYSLAEIAPNRFLIGTNRGMVEFNYNTKKFNYYEPLKAYSRKLPNRHMLLHRDTLWVVSYARLLMHDLKTKQTKEYRNFKFPSNIRQSNNITCVGLDHLGRKWIGTNSGISVFDPKTESFRYTPLEPDPRKDSLSVMVLSIQSINRQLWVGSFQQGLYIFDMDGKELRKPVHLTQHEGLPDNTIYGCLPDNNGLVWISSNLGLATYDAAKKIIVRYGTVDGLQENEFNRLTFLKSSKGEMYFGGINGFNVFKPEDIVIPKFPLTPKILSVRVLNDPEGTKAKTRFFPEGKDLRFSYDNNSVEVKFFIPVYIHSARYKISVKLEGFDREWQTLIQNNTANYYNLKPGDYQFLVQTTNHLGEALTTSFRFEVSRPFWSTWWFILISIAVVISLFIVTTAWRARRIREENKKLALLLSIKSKEILESKNELESLNQKKDLIFSILSHDLRSPLTTLKGFLGLLIDSDDITREEIKKHATNIRHSVTNALDLIDNTLYWSLSQMGTITYDPASFSVSHLFEKVKGLYALTAEKKKITLDIHTEAGLQLWGDENMIYVAIRNLVSNALKFTSEGKKVSLQASLMENQVCIVVKDEGIGMTAEELQRIINSDITFIKRGTSSEKGTGIGLSLCKKFIEMNKGTLEIQSSENQGSMFIIKLPRFTQQSSDSTPGPSVQS